MRLQERFDPNVPHTDPNQQMPNLNPLTQNPTPLMYKNRATT